MGFGGKLQIGLFAVLGMLALPSAAAASTTITVNSQADAPLASAGACESTHNNECTLLAAVELANKVSNETSGETVTVEVPKGKYENSLGGVPAFLYVEEGANVVIDGAGAGKTIIDGGGEGSVLEVDEFAGLTLHGVTVQHGAAIFGGGIDTNSFDGLTIEESAIEDNRVLGDGGGIYANEPSYTVIKNSTIKHNEAENGGGLYADFGAAVVISDSTIDENAVDRDGGGVAVQLISEEAEACGFAKSSKSSAKKAGAKPAAVAGELSAWLTVQQSTIDHNTAAEGGGIYAWQDNEQCPDISRAMHGTARAHAAVKSAQPALIGPSNAASLAIEQTTIAYNRAEEFNNDGDFIGGYGGGIYEEGSLYDPIVNSTIADNFATRDGGGIYAAAGDYDALINDTVFDNTDKPVTRDSAARRLADPAATELPSPGNNLATQTDNGSEINLRNTIVAEPKGQENCEGEVYGAIHEGGYNLDYPSNAPEHSLDGCGLEEGNNLRNVNPLLEEELKSNGGATQTLALTSSSPAIGYVPLAGDCEEGESGWGPAMHNEKGELEKPVDQRGEKRPGLPGRGCDIGAYELQATPEVKAEAKPEEQPAHIQVPATASVLPFKITASPQCASKREITIHIQNVKQFGIVSAVVEIDGHHKKTLTGAHLTAAINLRGLPTGTFTIEIVARTDKGHELTGQRVYHTCHSKLPGHSYLPL